MQLNKAFLVLTTVLLINSLLWSTNKNSNKGYAMKVKLKNANIYFTSKGSGDTTLLFIHGWCINSSYWEDQQDYFSSEYKTIALDLPGFGNSEAERENWTIEEYSRDILSFIDHLNLKNVILIGHSMAGEIILETSLARHSAIKGIVGIDNFKMIDVQFTPQQYEEMNGFLKMIEKDFKNTAPFYAERMLLSPSTDESVSSRIKSDFASSNPNVALSSLNNFINYTMGEAGKLAKLDYKLYLLNSDVIPTNMQGLENHCKNSFEVFEIEASSHYPMIENPGDFNKVLQKIVNSI